MKHNKSFPWLEAALILLCFAVCLAGALLLPVDQCPDEWGHLQLSNWVAAHGSLPTGDEAAVMIEGWGFSYALRPYLSAIVGAAFQKLASLFTDSERVLLAASRLCSVLSVTGVCVLCLRLGRRLFEKRASGILFAVLVCFLPQVQFLGMYQNNDSLSLCAVCAILCAFVEGYDKHWSVKSCVVLGLSLSLGLLSYYACYGWILCCGLFCVAAVLRDETIGDKPRFLLRRIALVVGLCLLLAGWFFVRNAILHDGDMLGIRSEATQRALAAARGETLYPYHCLRNEGFSLLGFLLDRNAAWLRTSVMSFIGVFGYMHFCMPKWRYFVYLAVFATGALWYFLQLRARKPGRKETLLLLLLLCGSAITFFLHLWQSYARDYEPQGRYVITLAPTLAFFLAASLNTVKPLRGRENCSLLHPASFVTILWLALFALTAADTMSLMLN